MKVFIGGSRHIARLPEEVIPRLQNIVVAEGTILIGDANGADKAVQQYLHEMDYKNVVVYYVGSQIRNNLGGWNTQNIECDSKKKDFYYYTCKDLAMSVDAEYGFMLWDGNSKGTINNALNLLRKNKSLLLFHSKKREFKTLKDMEDLRLLLHDSSGGLKERLILELKMKEFSHELSQQSLTYSEAINYFGQGEDGRKAA